MMDTLRNSHLNSLNGRGGKDVLLSLWRTGKSGNGYSTHSGLPGSPEQRKLLKTFASLIMN